jgi:coenzyme F420-0:L-glutamate ligase/coenzyme F420-1:gamma-L-glutamate ligase
MNVPDLALFRLPGIPLIKAGDDLAACLTEALARAGLRLEPGDVLAVAQKIVSKAEGRLVYLADVTPSPQAEELAARTAKDPRVVQLILDESLRVVRTRPGAIIVEHRLGIVLANAGIDRSNLADSEAAALLLPRDPDASARSLRAELAQRAGLAPGVLITDSVGRPWRLGTLGIAIGCAGVSGLTDLRGTEDLFGRLMETSEISPADSLAAAATLMMGEGAEGTPAVLVRGWPDTGIDQPAAAILRPGNEDLFR